MMAFCALWPLLLFGLVHTVFRGYRSRIYDAHAVDMGTYKEDQETQNLEIIKVP